MPRYGDELTPTGKRDTTYGKELWKDSNGDLHFLNDLVGTVRAPTGQLLDSRNRRYKTDDNSPAADGIGVRGVPDTSKVASHTATGNQSVDVEVRMALQARADVASQRQTLWDEQLDAIAEKLRAHDITVDAPACSVGHIDDLLSEAAPFLSAAERMVLRAAGREYAQMTDQLVACSERIGTAGAAVVVAREIPNGITLTSDDGERGTSGNADRWVYDIRDDGTLVCVEGKGVGGRLTSRFVDDPDNPDGDRIRAQQCSFPYVTHMARHDYKLARALGADPAMRATVQQAVDDGRVRVIRVDTNEYGNIKRTDYQFDTVRLQGMRITVAGTPDRPEDQ
ncbi:hypothetical protein ACFO1B_52885 [Dactylosporangium siamense]|uniref:Uncharacterized protein n=1 Tax=Dactylosporangium siamense TaxID=685454 RepID=A0A919UHP1_9ACTN|nr:hypothetical protein [Dactylosporangium siamense]GIG52601.1 hypothetical protein Dsi01nite_106420 [Dactylosporangium siamense]